MKDNSDGKYIITVKATLAGKNSLVVVIGGERLHSTPQLLVVAGGLSYFFDSSFSLLFNIHICIDQNLCWHFPPTAE